MTPQQARARIENLLRLAAVGSGATEEEARTAAIQAARLMAEHGLAPEAASGESSSDAVLDDLEILALKAQVQALEHVLEGHKAAHLKQTQDWDRQWQQVVQTVRFEERAGGNTRTRNATVRAGRMERENLARTGGRARDKALSGERKTEIAREAARARWARWREQHQG